MRESPPVAIAAFQKLSIAAVLELSRPATYGGVDLPLSIAAFRDRHEGASLGDLGELSEAFKVLCE
jgi:hypothetical protein